MIPFVRSFCAFAALAFDQNPTPRPVVAPAPTTSPITKPSEAELDAAVDAREEEFIRTTEPGWVTAERIVAEEAESLARIMRRRQIVLTRADAAFEAQVAVAPEPAPVEAMGDIIDTLAVTSLYQGDVVLVGNAKGFGVHEEKVVDVQRISAKKVVVLTDKGAFEALATTRVYLAKTVSNHFFWGPARETAWTPTPKMAARATESKPRSMSDVARGDELAKLIAEQAADARTASRRRDFARLPADPMEGYEGLVLACEDFLGDVTALGFLRPTEEPEAPKVVGPVRWLGSKQRALDLA